MQYAILYFGTHFVQLTVKGKFVVSGNAEQVEACSPSTKPKDSLSLHRNGVLSSSLRCYVCFFVAFLKYCFKILCAVFKCKRNKSM